MSMPSVSIVLGVIQFATCEWISDLPITKLNSLHISCVVTMHDSISMFCNFFFPFNTLLKTKYARFFLAFYSTYEFQHLFVPSFLSLLHMYLYSEDFIFYFFVI